MSTHITMNEQQTEAITSLLEYIQNPDPDSWFFVLRGFAGTGKTFCMQKVVQVAAGSQVEFAFTAPTNKAAKVLRNIVGEASTIYSLLGLRIDKSGELKELVAGKVPDLSDLNVVFVDEGSMVSRNLFNILGARAELHDFRVVFLGDPAQLPPVGEAESPIWECDSDACLTKVVRHDNQILKLVTQIRGLIGHPAPSISLKSDNDGAEGVWKMTKAAFKMSIHEAAARGEFADGTVSKVIAWRNIRVAEYNDLIRQAIFGVAAVPGEYLVGDRIVAAAPCLREAETLMATDEEALVDGVKVCKHPLEPRYTAIELKVITENGETKRLLVIHPSSVQQFNNDSERLAHEARGNGKLWSSFWAHKELFHEVKYAYALTTHRSQGSTYQNVWVDYDDILYNRNRTEAFQCLYVACSRPTTRLYLA